MELLVFKVNALAEEVKAGKHEQQGAAEASTTTFEKISVFEPVGRTTTVANRTGKIDIEITGSASHVDGVKIERSTVLRDLFFAVTGTDLMSTGPFVCEFNIRGLQGPGRVAVIIGGARQSFEIFEYGRGPELFIDPSLLKKVNVILGPVANTYGSGSIGEVVSVETKDAGDALKNNESYTVSSKGGYEANVAGLSAGTTAAMRNADRQADIIAAIVRRYYSNRKTGEGTEQVGSGFDSRSALIKAAARPSETSEVKLRYIHGDDQWDGAVTDYDYDAGQDTLTARCRLADPLRNWLDLHIDASLNMVDYSQKLPKDKKDRASPGGDDFIEPAGARRRQNLNTHGLDLWNTQRLQTGAVCHQITYGGDLVFDDAVNRIINNASTMPSGKRWVWGSYVEDEAPLGRFDLDAALRYDHYRPHGTARGISQQIRIERGEDRLSPRLSLGVHPFTGRLSQGLRPYGGYASGYRSPTIKETLWQGYSHGTTSRVLPNPELKPETGKDFGGWFALCDRWADAPG